MSQETVKMSDAEREELLAELHAAVEEIVTAVQNLKHRLGE